jgi:hypothetical protein
MKTSELKGAALDWAVAKLEGKDWNLVESFLDYYDEGGMHYADDWAQGGPIIEREGMNIRAIHKEGHAMNGQWLAAYDYGNTGTMVHWVKRTDWPMHYLSGPTPLIAAMRCYVASKLGDEVNIPEELK